MRSPGPARRPGVAHRLGGSRAARALASATLVACAGPSASPALEDTAAPAVTIAPWRCDTPTRSVTYADLGWELVDTTDAIAERGPGSGALVADLDGDGDDDLVLTRREGDATIHWNEGDQFALEPLGFPGPAYVAAAYDVDEDGRIDLLLGGEAREGVSSLWVYTGDGAGGFDRSAAPLVDDLGPLLGLAATDYDGDGHVDLYVTDARTDRLLRGLGGGAFADLTAEAGLGGVAALSWGAVWVDADADGDDDLVLTNDLQASGPTSALLRNDAGAFVRADLGTLFVNSMGAIAFDHDQDGRADVYVSGTGPNGLYLGEGDGRFLDVSRATGADGPNGVGRMSLGAVAIDADVDGDVDLLTACGRVGLEAELATQDTAQPDLFLRREGDLYADAAAEVGFGDDGDGRSLVAGFFSDDGTPDFVVGHVGEPSRVWASTCTAATSLLVALRGTVDNAVGLGARVTLHTDAGDRHAWITLSSGLSGHQAPRAFFGLGSAAPLGLTIAWPSGDVQEVALPEGASGRVTVTQGG